VFDVLRVYRNGLHVNPLLVIPGPSCPVKC
jgi:hypothetical protein